MAVTCGTAMGAGNPGTLQEYLVLLITSPSLQPLNLSFLTGSLPMLLLLKKPLCQCVASVLADAR